MEELKGQYKLDPEFRKARSQKARQAKADIWLIKREDKIANGDFDDLNKSEKRIRIFNEQNGACNICKLQNWNSIPITLELDHISGNRKDETRTNLRLICPNCHSQTDTYKSLNNKNLGKKTYSDDEIVEVLLVESSLYKVLTKLGMNPHGGNYTRLRKIIKDRNIRSDLIF